MSWGSLGDIAFEPLGGPMEEAYKFAVDLSELATLGHKPRLQHLGEKLQELTLRIRLHSSLNINPELDLRALKDSMGQGEVLDLVLGEQTDLGIWAGTWVIASMDLRVEERWPGGRLRSAELTLTLKEWTAPPDLQVSQRKAPPKAVRPKAKAPTPAVQAGPGYEGGKPPGGA